MSSPCLRWVWKSAGDAIVNCSTVGLAIFEDFAFEPSPRVSTECVEIYCAWSAPATTMLLLPLALLYCLSVPKASASWWAAQEVVTAANTSSQIRFISPLDNAVLGGKPSPAFDSTDTQRVEPEFHVYSSKFEKLLGPKAKVQRIVHVDGYAFAHEAPIWHKPTNELFFSS